MLTKLFLSFAIFASEVHAKITGSGGTGWKGKVGNHVYCMHKGTQVVKTRSIPHNPQSEAQTIRRNIIKIVAIIGQQLLTVFIKPVWNGFGYRGISGWSKWMGLNLKAQTTFPIDPTLLIFGDGGLYNPGITEAKNASGLVTIPFPDDIQGDALATDFAVAIVYNESTNTTDFSDIAATRDDGSVTVHTCPGDDIVYQHAYLVFFRQNEDETISLMSGTAYEKVLAQL